MGACSEGWLGLMEEGGRTLVPGCNSVQMAILAPREGSGWPGSRRKGSSGSWRSGTRLLRWLGCGQVEKQAGGSSASP